ncbi:MAG: septal ring lytic transglycosylase RlpA family protein [Spirochaetes bacterium]|nr:septal ring lytic transglycosylase RlpA family protein [Spirochaetota bacterium]
MNTKTKWILCILNLIIFNMLSFSEQTGIASWYGPNFHGKITANGEIFNTNEYTAAHQTLPFNTMVKVISLENNREVIVRINDRGPFAKNRIIDLSKKAATDLDLIKKGTMQVKVIVLKKGNNTYYQAKKYAAQKYYIQFASFQKKESAERLLNKLLNQQIPGKIYQVKINNTDYYRVLSPVYTYLELQNVKTKLQTKGFSQYLVKNYTYHS